MTDTIGYHNAKRIRTDEVSGSQSHNMLTLRLQDRNFGNGQSGGGSYGGYGHQNRFSSNRYVVLFACHRLVSDLIIIIFSDRFPEMRRGRTMSFSLR